MTAARRRPANYDAPVPALDHATLDAVLGSPEHHAAPQWARTIATVRQARVEGVAPAWSRYLSARLEAANARPNPVRLSRAALLEVTEPDCARWV